MGALLVLSQGQVAVIDAEDFERASAHCWHLIVKGQYAAAWMDVDGKQKHVYLHRFILNAPRGTEVDHKDGNGLDCRKQNLRLVSHKQNMWNSRKRSKPASSKYKGVAWYTRHGKWRARIMTNGKDLFLGYFKTEEEAARAYDVAASEHRGSSAKLNLQEA